MDLSDLVGIPYVENGLDPRPKPKGDGGLYCWGLVRLALHRFGVALPERPEDALLEEGRLAVQCLTGVPRAGDVLIIGNSRNLRNGGEPLRHPLGLHVGVCLDGESFLHTLSGYGESHVASIASYRSAGRILRRVRPRKLAPTGGGA